MLGYKRVGRVLMVRVPTVPMTTDDLQLLLCDGEEYIPVLEDGLPEDALVDAPSPAFGPRSVDAYDLDSPHADPNDLEKQRWGVIVPYGATGDRMLEAIDVLVQHRGTQQSDSPKIYRVDPDMDVAAAFRWRKQVHLEESVDERERPRYLLILGDLHEVSLELQHVLANGAFVGRLCCSSLAGFRSYAEKLVSREQEALQKSARALFYTVQDSTRAVLCGYQQLVKPCLERCEKLAASERLAISGSAEVPYSDWGPEDLIEEAGDDNPAVMLSLSHGIGAPRRGWSSVAHQHARQGALALGNSQLLTADDLRATPFLSGGVWFSMACFFAGTPSASAYYPWLRQLAECGEANAHALQHALASLPRSGERPFVAALPQALLANPKGPLALIGHMDLAWTYSFTDTESKQSRASRVFSTLRALLEGSRVGVGLDALMRTYREVNDELTARYQLQANARAREQVIAEDPGQLAHLWMQRNDLRGFVLLGDPAARVAVQAKQVKGEWIQERSSLDAPVELETIADASSTREPSNGIDTFSTEDNAGPPVESPTQRASKLHQLGSASSATRQSAVKRSATPARGRSGASARNERDLSKPEFEPPPGLPRPTPEQGELGGEFEVEVDEPKPGERPFKVRWRLYWKRG